MKFRFEKLMFWRKLPPSEAVEYQIDIQSYEGDDVICQAAIGDWKCLVIQSAEDRNDVAVLPGNDDWDAFISVPWTEVERMNGDLSEYVPMLVTFAFKLSHNYNSE